MSIPAPFPGLVIRYSYLWHREHRAKQEEGSKDRPAAILMASSTKDAATRVFALPITHSEPTGADETIPIPMAVKRLIGLDTEPSWIVLDELNEFIWPGFDLAVVPGSEPPSYEYGVLPPSFYDRVRDAFLALHDARKVKSVRRD